MVSCIKTSNDIQLLARRTSTQRMPYKSNPFLRTYGTNSCGPSPIVGDRMILSSATLSYFSTHSTLPPAPTPISKPRPIVAAISLPYWRMRPVPFRFLHSEGREPHRSTDGSRRWRAAGDSSPSYLSIAGRCLLLLLQVLAPSDRGDPGRGPAGHEGIAAVAPRDQAIPDQLERTMPT
jgi:hypothetical protein